MATNDVSNTSCVDEEREMAEIIVRKRRSSIFHSQITLCSQLANGSVVRNDEIESTSNKSEIEHAMCTDTDTFNLIEYIEKLKQERKDWLREYRDRKAKRRNLYKQKMSVERQGQSLDLNVLAESERAFVMARPNYEQICRNRQKLLDVTQKIFMLDLLISKLNGHFIEKMEANMSKVTKRVIRLSD